MAIRQLAPALRELIERRRAQTAVGGGELPELVVTDDDRAEANRRLDDDDRAPSQYRLLLEVLVTRERQLRDAIAQRDEAREHAKFKTNMANDLNELLEAAESKLAAIEAQRDEARRRTERYKTEFVQLDAIIDEEGVARSCINPFEDLRLAIRGLKTRAETAEAKLAALPSEPAGKAGENG
jgi:chromosome segregation ATPase